MKWGSQLLTLLLLVGVLGAVFAPPKPRGEVFEGRVTWVSDGDTFKIEGHNWPIRLWGVDAPERDTEKGQIARDYVSAKIKGRVVSCEKVVVDKYKRTVAKCFVDGASLAKDLLNKGHGVEMCSFTRGALGTC